MPVAQNLKQVIIVEKVFWSINVAARYPVTMTVLTGNGEDGRERIQRYIFHYTTLFIPKLKTHYGEKTFKNFLTNF